jgi:hypothetical protein
MERAFEENKVFEMVKAFNDDKALAPSFRLVGRFSKKIS